jgi:hypothetical protein
MSQPLRARSHRNAPTLRIVAAGAEFAYREFGPHAGVPLVVLTHLGAKLDSWDPRIAVGLAEDRHVVAGVTAASAIPLRRSVTPPRTWPGTWWC